MREVEIDDAEIEGLDDGEIAEVYNEKMSEEAKKMAAEEAKMLALGWPPALIKALNDPFDYALELRTGTRLYFTEASDVGNGWVHLDLDGKIGEDQSRLGAGGSLGRLTPDRGIDVRIADIVWCADAPFSS